MVSKYKVLFAVWLSLVLCGGAAAHEDAVPVLAQDGVGEYFLCSGAPAPVPKTGQTRCWNGSGTLIDCAGTGPDGEYQYGVSVEYPRFADNGDGTVTDNLTNLIWLQDATCFGLYRWADAVSLANTLADGFCGLSDGSVVGDWRLPNLRELQSLIDYDNVGPALPEGHPFSTVSFGYWSSTSLQTNEPVAWWVEFTIGRPGILYKNHFLSLWPVRGGQ